MFMGRSSLDLELEEGLLARLQCGSGGYTRGRHGVSMTSGMRIDSNGPSSPVFRIGEPYLMRSNVKIHLPMLYKIQP